MNKIHIDEIPKENSICFYTRHTIYPSERTILYTLARQRIIECASEGLTNIILSLGDEYQVIAGRAALELRQKYNLHIYIILPYFCGCFCGAMWDRRLIQDASEIMELADGVTWLVLKYDGFSLGKSKHRTIYDSHMDYIANYFPKATIIIFRRVTNRNTGVYSMNEFATKYNSRIKNLTNTAAFKRLYRIQFNRKEAITEIAPINSSFIEELKRDNVAYIVYKPGNEEIGWDNLYQAAKEEALQIVPSLYYQNGIRNYLVSIDTPAQIAIAEAILDFKRDTPDIKLYCIMKEDNNTDLIEPIFGELLYDVIEWIVLFANRLASVPDKKWKTMIDDMCSDFVYLVSPDSRYLKSEGMHIEEYPHGVIHGLYSIQNALLELDKQTWIEELVRYARYAGARGDVIREFRDELSNRNVNNLFAILCVSFPIPQSITWGVNEKSIYSFPDSARVSYCMDEIYRSLAERPKLRTGLRLVTGLDLEYQALPQLQPRPEDTYQIRFIGCGEITNYQAKRLLPLLSAIIALSCLIENKRVEFTSDLGLYNTNLWSAGCMQARAAYGLTKDYTYQYDCRNLTPYQVRLLYSMPTIDYSLASLKLSFLEYQRMLSENPTDLCIIIYNKRNLFQMKNQSEVLVMCKESNVKAIPLPVQLDIKADGMKILQKIYPSELLSKPEASEILNRLEVFKDN